MKWCEMFLTISGKKSEMVVSDVEGVGAEDEGEDRVEIENIEGDNIIIIVLHLIYYLLFLFSLLFS